jgi:hypothetical protein
MHAGSSTSPTTRRAASALLLLLLLLLLALAAACAAAPPGGMALSLVTKPAGRLWSSYCRQLERRPLLSRVATGVVGTIISDALAQHAAAGMAGGRRGKYDFGRTARLVVWSALGGTPIAYKWFAFLDRVRAAAARPAAGLRGRAARRPAARALSSHPPRPARLDPRRPSCRTAPPTPGPCSSRPRWTSC